MKENMVLVDYDGGVITIVHKGGGVYSFSPPYVCFSKMFGDVKLSTWLPNITPNKHTGAETNDFLCTLYQPSTYW